jgi:hypothetical protein
MRNPSYYKKNQFLPGCVKDFSESELSQMNLNSLDYRTKEFDSVEWQDSVVIFGCSNVFGTGLSDTETISHQLEKIIQRPVINMGVPSSSISYSLFNQVILAEQCSKPYAVINIWSSINRLPYFFDRTPYHVGPWTERLNNTSVTRRSLRTLFQSWNVHNRNPEINSMFLQRIADLLWRDTKHIQGTFFHKAGELFNVKLYDYLDYASDNQHPGPLSAKAVAEDLSLWCR